MLLDFVMDQMWFILKTHAEDYTNTCNKMMLQNNLNVRHDLSGNCVETFLLQQFNTTIQFNNLILLYEHVFNSTIMFLF